ncbi:hypothetical protein FRB97_003547, partial [Tulasnella sp. 331]
MPPEGIATGGRGGRGDRGGARRGRGGARGGRGGARGGRGGAGGGGALVEPAPVQEAPAAPTTPACGGGGGTARGRGGRGGGGGGGRGGAAGARGGHAAPAGHLTTVGIKRPSYGRAGNAIKVRTNLFEMKLDSPILYHYEAIVPETKVLPLRLMKEIYQALRAQNPNLFATAAYDGRKNLYTARRFPFDGDSQEYQVTLDAAVAAGAVTGQGEPMMHRVCLTKTHQDINPEVLRQYVEGQQSYNVDVTIAINALNVAAQMFPGDNPRYTPYG